MVWYPMLYIPEEIRKGLLSQQVLTPKQKQAIANMLRSVDVRPTRPRLIVAHCLFREKNRRVTPDELYREVTDGRLFISLATVYNCLNLFASVGLLRKYSITGDKTYFDTNVDGHRFFYCSDSDAILPLAVPTLSLVSQPDIPDGFYLDKVDIIIHLKQKDCKGQG